jgi:prepilin-type N-terminal cleavage/methylation domain-containing protein
MDIFHIIFHRKGNSKRTSVKKNAGFTFLEMMVSITIFVLLAAVLLARNSQFQGTTVLTNLAYELALNIRQAQVYGVDVVSNGFGTAQNFTYGYGVDYSTASPSAFTLFADQNNDLRYTGSPPDSIISQTQLPSAQYYIARVQVISQTSTVTTYCSDSGSNQFADIDITYKRPNPNAIIYISNSSGSLMKDSNNNPAMAEASFFIESTTGEVREIDVYADGQVAVNESPATLAASCP